MELTKTGLEAITQTFAAARSENRVMFMPYLMVGFPDYDTSIQALEALAAAGADAIEVGIPFSDPLADGPTNQHASQVSLNNGTRVTDCIEAVRTLRQRGVTIPLILMGYVNPLIAYGLERFARDAAEAGASGFIVPDLPPEEAGELLGYCDQNGLALIPMLAPTSTPDRIRQVVSNAKGFIYLVAVTGVTGARDSLPPDLTDYVRRVRGLTTLPLAIGFGIRQPEQVKSIGTLADGAVVGSALVQLLESKGLSAVKDLATSLHAACGR